jgi:hypothetical protein
MEIVIITGVGRSGTSLLQSMLGSHKDIAFPPETAYIRKNIMTFKKFTKGSAKWFMSKNSRFERVKIFKSMELDKIFFNELDFYNWFLNSFRLFEKKCLVGDKDPKLIESIIGCSKLFKKVRFIHIYRDPRDVLSSKKFTDWSKGRPYWINLMVNYAQLKLGMIAFESLGSNSIKHVKYEKLILEPIDTLKSVAEFLNLSFDQGMLDYQKKASELVSDQEMQWKGETLKPIKSSNIGKWKKSLKSSEIFVTELVCREVFKFGNYQQCQIKYQFSLFMRIYFFIFSDIIRIGGNVYVAWKLLTQKLILGWKL